MKKYYCDGCNEELISALSLTIVKHSNGHSYPQEMDFCIRCRDFLNNEMYKAWLQLRDEPEKYKINYDI